MSTFHDYLLVEREEDFFLNPIEDATKEDFFINPIRYGSRIPNPIRLPHVVHEDTNPINGVVTTNQIELEDQSRTGNVFTTFWRILGIILYLRFSISTSIFLMAIMEVSILLIYYIYSYHIICLRKTSTMCEISSSFYVNIISLHIIRLNLM